jgi:hypothetical protein
MMSALESDDIQNSAGAGVTSQTDQPARVLQCETKACVQRISQSPLEFESGASSFREFVENEQQKVLHL